MASHKSAEKRARQTIKRTVRNTAIKSQLKTAVKSFRSALTGSDAAQTQTSLTAATRLLRKAASQKVLHPCTVNRRVSRLAKAWYAKQQSSKASASTNAPV